jgi:hypothetical protein
MSDTNNEESQLLDDDVLPEEYPPEQPYGVNERLTAAEEQIDEPLADRVKRERPDSLSPGRDTEVGRLVAPGGDEGLDLEDQEVASEIARQPRRDQLDPGDLGAGDSTLRDTATERGDVMSAEEAAMHVTDEPPMGDGDGYLED